MKRILKAWMLLMALAGMASIPACNTTEGVGEDLEEAGEEIEEAADEVEDELDD